MMQMHLRFLFVSLWYNFIFSLSLDKLLIIFSMLLKQKATSMTLIAFLSMSDESDILCGTLFNWHCFIPLFTTKSTSCDHKKIYLQFLHSIMIIMCTFLFYFVQCISTFFARQLWSWQHALNMFSLVLFQFLPLTKLF